MVGDSGGAILPTELPVSDHVAAMNGNKRRLRDVLRTSEAQRRKFRKGSGTGGELALLGEVGCRTGSRLPYTPGAGCALGQRPSHHTRPPCEWRARAGLHAHIA